MCAYVVRVSMWAETHNNMHCKTMKSSTVQWQVMKILKRIIILIDIPKLCMHRKKYIQEWN